jgi:3-mercaptopyruvate sulfurtransferase SseA
MPDYAHPDILVETDQVAHLPDAVTLDWMPDLSDLIRRDLADAPRFAQRLTTIGR